MSQYQVKYPEADHFFQLEEFSSGRCSSAWRTFGAHPATDDSGQAGYIFRLWAPKARSVALVGDFNDWDSSTHPMTSIRAGIWERFVPGLTTFDRYRFAVETPEGEIVEKADPFAFHADLRPLTASRLYDFTDGHSWGDRDWMDYRARLTPHTGPTKPPQQCDKQYILFFL